MLELPYGRVRYHVSAVALDGRDATVLAPSPLPRPPPIRRLISAALDAPIGSSPDKIVSHGARVTVIVSDPTRHEDRRAMIEAIRERLPSVRWTLAVATGTHGPCRLDRLDLPEDLLSSATIVNHDGHSPEGIVELGVTRHGTPMRVHRCVVEADLVVATGCIRPHYFAGFGAGVKAVFPGLGDATSVRINHRLKTEPGSRAGVVDGNPCRADLEDAFQLVPTPTFLLNTVVGPDDLVHGAVAGDPIAAFREGAARARAWFAIRARRSPLVIASDQPPVTETLYQAAKIAAAAAPLVDENGTLLIVAECSGGTGPLDVVNEAIFRLGVLPRLPRGARIRLVSELPQSIVDQTLLEYAPSVDSVLRDVPGPILIIPRASPLILEPSS